MHLRAVKLRGFKSFPDPVEIRLEPGVGVIVGPNGSGKSNVSDAIRWAAGSLSPTELRAEKPDDVLFAGGGGRGPADFCEVELLFDNADGTLPVDYAELAVARRLHRGGEGQYLVNRTPVRRLDLVELLADLGLGQGMHSIISQGKVEAILGSRPTERRALIEEAAGLGRFKARRHRAELKLARVAVQVERARDVEQEVKKRLRPLALQATAAERARKLAVEIAGLRARIAELDIVALEETLREIETRRETAVTIRDGVEERLETVLAERGRAEEELADAAGAREQALQSLYRLRSAAERVELRRESATELLAEARLRHEAAAGDSDPTAELGELERAFERASAAARHTAIEREAAAERARRALARLLVASRAVRGEADSRLEQLLAERRSIERELTSTAGEREAALSVSYELRSGAATLALQRESAERLVAGLRAELAEAEAQAARSDPSPAELEERALAVRAVARDAALERDTLADRARTAAERLATLERSLAEREGLPPAARALAEEGERLVLAELEIEPGTERAVAAALGPRAAALVAADPQAALALLERAAELGLGSLLVVVGRDPRDLLAGLPVVEKDALLTSRTPAVTTDGFGYDPRSGELWYAGETAEAVLLELDVRRRGLAEEAKALAEQARFAERKAAEAQERAAAAEAAFAAVTPQIRIRRADTPTLTALAAAARRLERALAGLDACVDRLEAPLRARGEAGAERTGELGVRLRALGGREAELRREHVEAVEALAAAERDLGRLGGRADAAADPVPESLGVLRDEARAAVALADEAASAAREGAERAREAEALRVEAAVRAGRRRARPHELARVVAAGERLDEALLAAATAAARFEAPLRAHVESGAARTGELGDELRRLGSAEVELRQELTAAAQAVSAVDVEAARVEAEADEARRRLEHARLGASAAKPPAPGEQTASPSASPGGRAAEGEDRDALAATLERLERRRETLGQVNPLAHEEYEAEKTRLEELSSQRADLEASLDELERLRAELTETVERRFDETFAAVQRHFDEVVGTLFPGGEGRLRPTETEEGEEAPGGGGSADITSGQGVEVELRPAGKRVQRLSLLSGGEKALGAISFLFALFLARPCPFYLLDEVEAALDDTNIGRFVELLRRYSDRAQFVVITHQKRTMEAADILYGVTMGGDGVSQVVSRRLAGDDAGSVAGRAGGAGQEDRAA